MVQIDIYIKEAIDFLRTVTLKNSLFADQILMNDVYEEYQDILPEELNPYYRHMMGEYILDGETTWVNGVEIPNRRIYRRLDEMIYIASLDTQEEIPFTKETLADHPKTYTLYKVPSTFFTKLCAKYPAYSDLIKSILYPLEDVQTAIAADNLTILNYSTEILQSNEIDSILEKLNQVLTTIRERWTVREYVYEDLFAVVHQGIIWQILYLTILLQRILNIRTSKAHDFHLWSFLNSRSIDDYRTNMTENQTLFLYRNIDYILKHKGTTRNFSILIGALMRPLNISIYRKSLVQNITYNRTDAESDETVSRAETVEPMALANRTQRTISLKTGTLTNTFANTCKPYPQILSNDAGDENIIQQTLCLVDPKEFFDYGKPIDVVQRVLNYYTMGRTPNSVMDVQTGDLETTEDTYYKEQVKELEYQDENLYTRSTEQQDRIFAVTPHTYLKSKLHEIKNNITSTVLAQIYAKFIVESFYYRAARGDMSIILSMIPPRTQTILQVDCYEAIALLLYLAAKTVGITLKTVPTSAYVEWPYRETFPDLTESIRYQSTEVKLQTQLSDYGFDGMKSYPGQFASTKDMCTKIHSQAINFIHNYLEIMRDSSAIHYEILMKVYQERCVNGWVQFDLLSGRTYEEFIDGTSGLRAILDLYEQQADLTIAYALFFKDLFDLFYPLSTLDVTEGKGLLLDDELLLTSQYTYLEELFINLCSYNISFVDQIVGAPAYSTLLCRLTFENNNTTIGGTYQFFWDELKSYNARTFIKFQSATLEPISMHVVDNNSWTSKFTIPIRTLLYDNVVAILHDYFYPIYHEPQVEGRYIDKYLRRYNSDYRETISLDLGDDPDYYEANDLPKTEQTYYSASTTIDQAGSRIKTYVPYQQPAPYTGMIRVHCTIAVDPGDTTGCVTPVYKDGVLVEVIEEKVRNWDEIPDYEIVNNQFVKINHTNL